MTDTIKEGIDRAYDKLENGIDIAGAILGIKTTDDTALPASTNARELAATSTAPALAAAPSSSPSKALPAVGETSVDADQARADADADVEKRRTEIARIQQLASFDIRRSRNLATDAVEFLVLGSMCHVVCPTEAHATAVRDALVAKLNEAAKAAA